MNTIYTDYSAAQEYFDNYMEQLKIAAEKYVGREWKKRNGAPVNEAELERWIVKGLLDSI